MAGYLGAIPVPQATQHRETFTATSGQTTFATAGYTVGFLDVYLNGSHLSPADFTATNGSDVVLASGASADDVCDIISYTAFEVNAQTFTGGLDVTGGITADGLTVSESNSTAYSSTGISSGTYNQSIVNTNTDANTGAFLALSSNDNGTGTAVIGSIAGSTLKDSQLVFLTRDGSASGDPIAERMRIDSSGNVGIGTNTPTDTLNVQAAAAGTAITLVESSDSGSNPAAFIGYRSRGTDLSGHTAIQANNTMTQFSAGAHDGNAFAVGSKVISTASQTWTTSAHGTRLGIFTTPDGSTTPAERMRIDSSGNVFVGCTSLPSASVQGFGLSGQTIVTSATSTSTREHHQFFNGNGQVGSIKTSGSSTSFNTSSDYRLKTDAQPMTGASARVQALNPVNFEWIVDGTRVDGFLAHEAQAVVPEAVTGTKDAMRDEEYEVTPAVLDSDGNETTPAVMGTRSVPDMQGIDQSKLVPLLVASLQEALARITALENA